VKIWDVETGEEVLTLPGHPLWVWSVALSLDGTRLASADGAGVLKVWDARPLTREIAVEREARGLLAFLFAKPLDKAAVRDHLGSLATITPPARQAALSFVDRYREETEPEKYRQASWAVIRQRYLNALQYDFALRQAETACRLAPEQGKYVTTLGAAQYRAGRYKEALATLTKADQLDQGSPAVLAFLAMTQHRLNQAEKAKTTLGRLREVMQNAAATPNRESADLLSEAEALMTGR
jgi:tetratricopeptide (TPR) repeat protein